MKFFNLFLAVIFTLFTIVQWNDPDPISWMSMYGFVAVVCALAAFSIRNRWVILAGLAACLIWMATLLPDFIHWIRMGAPTIIGEMKATTSYVELTREFLGLVLAGLTLGWQYWKAPRGAAENREKQ